MALRLSEDEADQLASAEVLIGYRNDGLFSRLLCFVNVIRLSETLGKPGVFLWDARPLAGNARHGYEVSLTSVLRDDRIVDVHPDDRRQPARERNVSAWPVILLPGEDAGAISQRYRQILRGLHLRDGTTLADRAARSAHPVAFHVRQGDAAELRWLGGRFLPLSVWRAAIDSIMADVDLGGSPAYLSTDSDAFRDEVVARFPGGVVGRGPGLSDETGLAGDMDEALVLASARRIVGQSSSAYATFAGTLGGIPVESPLDILGIRSIIDDIWRLAFSEYVRDVRRSQDPAPLEDKERGRIKRNLLTMERRLRTVGDDSVNRSASPGPDT